MSSISGLEPEESGDEPSSSVQQENQNVSRGVFYTFLFIFLKVFLFATTLYSLRLLPTDDRGHLFPLQTFYILATSCLQQPFRRLATQTQTFYRFGFILFASVAIPGWYLLVLLRDGLSDPNLFISGLIFAGAVVVEAIGEPFWAVLVSNQDYGQQTFLLFVSGLIQRLIQCFYPSLLGFSVGQAIGSLLLTFGVIGSVWYYSRSTKNRTEVLDIKHTTFKSVLFQSCLEIALAEMEKVVLVHTVQDLPTLGAYDTLNRFGSILVRLLFRKIDQLTFQTCCRSSTPFSHFTLLLKFVFIVSSLLFCCVPTLGYRILILLGLSETNTQDIYVLYAISLLFWSLNGVCEAYHRAIYQKTNSQIHSTSLFYIFVSVFNLLMAILLGSFFEIKGTLVGNILTMGIRIAFVWFGFIRSDVRFDVLWKKVIRSLWWWLIGSIVMGIGIEFGVFRFVVKDDVVSRSVLWGWIGGCTLAVGLMELGWVWFVDSEWMKQMWQMVRRRGKTE